MKKSHVIAFVTVLVLSLVFSTCSSSPDTITNATDELDMTLREVSDYLNESIPPGRKIAFINIQSTSVSLTEYIIDILMANAVNDRIFSVVDRQQLDAARTELNFNMSGEVSDQSAQSVGQMLGAQTIITGRISQIGERYRLNIRALEVETVQVQGSNNWNIVAGATITALMHDRSGGGTQAVITRATGDTGITSNMTDSRPPVPIITSVTINPATTIVEKGQSFEFGAEISGVNNPDLSVVWAVSGNLSRGTSINENGILTVASDEIATPLTVTVTSTVDHNKNASATVTVPGGISPINVNNVSGWNSAVNRIRNGGNNQAYIINITGNVSVPAPPDNENIFGSVTGLTVSIQGNGTLSLSVSGCLLRIGAGQTVIVRDVTLRGRSDNNKPVIIIIIGGLFRMEGSASVTGNVSSGSGGGVFIDGGTFIMQDSTSVTNNTVTYYTSDGGGVYLNSGTFIMYNGTISGNTCSYDMSRVRANGGGVFINGGTFTMHDGTISGNTTHSSGDGGGGVCVFGGTFTMEGGMISGNTSGNSGGGVFIGGRSFTHGTFTMRGGTIANGNNANGFGGGVHVASGTFNKTGGTINGNDVAHSNRNISTRQGHAIYLNSNPARWRNATAEPDDRTDGFGFWLND